MVFGGPDQHGFLNTPELVALLEDTPKLADQDLDSFDGLVCTGGLSPMFTYRGNVVMQTALVHFYEAEKLVAVHCHGVSALIDAIPACSALKEPDRTRLTLSAGERPLDLSQPRKGKRGGRRTG